MRDLGLETPTEHVLFEVLTPFVTFLAAEELGVSGILAVVSAGLLMPGPRETTVENLAYALPAKAIWELLTFVINGTLFVLLGMKLPATLGPILRVSQGTDAAAVCGLVVPIRQSWWGFALHGFSRSRRSTARATQTSMRARAQRRSCAALAVKPDA